MSHVRRYILDDRTGEWIEVDKIRRTRANGNYFTPRTYYNMADHPVYVDSPGKLREALKKFDCFERG